MQYAGLYFKRSVFKFEQRKKLGIKPDILMALILTVKYWDNKGEWIKPTQLLNVAIDLLYLNNFRDVKKYLVLLHDKGMLIAKDYGKPSINGKFLQKYKPSAAGRLFITEFWQYYEDECKRLANV